MILFFGMIHMRTSCPSAAFALAALNQRVGYQASTQHLLALTSPAMQTAATECTICIRADTRNLKLASQTKHVQKTRRVAQPNLNGSSHWPAFALHQQTFCLSSSESNAPMPASRSTRAQLRRAQRLCRRRR
eukprot:1774396-Pleurochrysis_carterae.AAC.2